MSTGEPGHDLDAERAVGGGKLRPDDLGGGQVARWLDSARATLLLATFLGFTLPLMPVQAVLLWGWPAASRSLPHWYHRRVCRLLGIRVRIEGDLAQSAPVLLVANHTSWLDIVVISALAPVSFVAKKEVAGWPLVAQLARLQRTVFVDRTRRLRIGDTASEMIERLAAGDALVLFAEGTSSDGNRVLPFKTSLLAAAKPTRSIGGEQGRSQRAGGAGGELAGAAPAALATAVVQTLSIVYTHLHGVPFGRADRPLVGWYGDMEMGSHAWALLKAGPLDVTLTLGAPMPLDGFSDRKHLAQFSEQQVRATVAGLLRGSTRRT